MSAKRRILSVIAYPLLLSTIASIAAYAIAGPSLGLFLAGLLLLTTLAPPLVVAEMRRRWQITALLALLLPILISWLVAASRSEIHGDEARRCADVSATYSFALAGLCVALRRLGCSSVVASALSVTLGLAWLTWPIWSSRTWQGEESANTIAMVARFHPAMLIDGQLATTSGGWTSQSVAYHLTDLNQNVSYSPPRVVWQCVVLHGLLGVACFALAGWRTEGNSQFSDGPPASAFPISAERS